MAETETTFFSLFVNIVELVGLRSLQRQTAKKSHVTFPMPEGALKIEELQRANSFWSWHLSLNWKLERTYISFLYWSTSDVWGVDSTLQILRTIISGGSRFSIYIKASIFNIHIKACQCQFIFPLSGLRITGDPICIYLQSVTVYRY